MSSRPMNDGRMPSASAAALNLSSAAALDGGSGSSASKRIAIAGAAGGGSGLRVRVPRPMYSVAASTSNRCWSAGISFGLVMRTLRKRQRPSLRSNCACRSGIRKAANSCWATDSLRPLGSCPNHASMPQVVPLQSASARCRWSMNGAPSNRSRCLPSQLAGCLHVGQHAVASRLREQRDVVTPALIAVGPAQVYDSRRMVIRARGARQILAGRDHARALDLERPIARVIDDNEYRHGRNSRLRGYTTSRLASCVTMPSRIAASTRSTLIQYSCGDPYGLGW